MQGGLEVRPQDALPPAGAAVRRQPRPARNLYRAYATRAAEVDNGYSKPEWDNGPLIKQILALRAEEARMLGYRNFADVSLVPKMADTPSRCSASCARPGRQGQALRREGDLAELQAFARPSWAWTPSNPGTWPTPPNCGSRYAFSEQGEGILPRAQGARRPVQGGRALYQVRIQPRQRPECGTPTCASSASSATAELIGQFYLDLYARDTKKGGAWMDSAISRRRIPGGIETPVAYLVCNFPGPVGGQAARHLQPRRRDHPLPRGRPRPAPPAHRVDDLAVSGIHGVEWDVELPSQFMENFCWEWDVVRDMTPTWTPAPRCPASSSTRCSPPRTSRAACRPCAS